MSSETVVTRIDLQSEFDEDSGIFKIQFSDERSLVKVLIALNLGEQDTEQIFRKVMEIIPDEVDDAVLRTLGARILESVRGKLQDVMGSQESDVLRKLRDIIDGEDEK